MLRLARLISIGYLVLCLAAVGLMSLIGPLGYAPFPLPIGPSREPITVSIVAGSETQVWLQEAIRRFGQTDAKVAGRSISITLDTSGSNTITQDIAQGTRTPAVFIPASTIQIAQLRAVWQQHLNQDNLIGTGSDAPQSLVTTPLVIVAWAERAQALWPTGPHDLWAELHDAVTNPDGWAHFGKPEWGQIKFAHTRPTTANSGLQTLLLMAYAYHHKTSGLSSADLNNPAFQQWLFDIEGNVPEFGDSTGTFMTDMVRFGPSKYDLVAVYENLAIQSFDSAQGRGGALHVYYPPATIVSDHPYAILNAPWVTSDQRQAAAAFRDYLLSPPIQQLALQSGFRPTNQTIQLTSADPTNPFTKYKDNGLAVSGVGQQVQLPESAVLDELTKLWQQKVNR